MKLMTNITEIFKLDENRFGNSIAFIQQTNTRNKNITIQVQRHQLMNYKKTLPNSQS